MASPACRLPEIGGGTGLSLVSLHTRSYHTTRGQPSHQFIRRSSQRLQCLKTTRDNTLTHWPLEDVVEVLNQFQTGIKDRYLEHFLWNHSQLNATRSHWYLVNIGSGNGLVLSGNKPLPEPMLTDLYCHMTSLGHNELNQYTGNIKFYSQNYINLLTDGKLLAGWYWFFSKLNWSSVVFLYTGLSKFILFVLRFV